MKDFLSRVFSKSAEKTSKKVIKDLADEKLIENELKQAGKESWTALSAALTESRKAFDRANQQAWDALKRAS